MDSKHEIYQFDSLDLVQYINDKHASNCDILEIEAEMNSHKALIKKIDENLYEFFVQSGDSLLSLLDTYKQCLDSINKFQVQTKTLDEPATEVFVSEELQKCFSKFNDNLGIFITENRFYVNSVFFNSGSFYCVLTNDLLFIGTKKENKYDLVRSVPKQNVKMNLNEKELEIILEDKKFAFTGANKDLEDFYNDFQEINYVSEPKNHVLDLELLDFYVKTKNFQDLEIHVEKLRETGEKDSKLKLNKLDDKIDNILLNVEICNEKELFSIMKIGSDPIKICNFYFLKRFGECIEINEIQEFKLYLNELFEKFSSLIENIVNFHKNYNESSKKKLSRQSLILFIEDCVKKLLKHLSKRITAHSKIFGEHEITEFLIKKLKFQKFDFSYLVGEAWDDSINSERSINREKKNILNELNEFFER